MSVSICKAWYKGGVIKLHKDFKMTLASKRMFLSEGYSWSDLHPAKGAGYFTDYNKSTEKLAIDRITQKALEGL